MAGFISSGFTAKSTKTDFYKLLRATIGLREAALLAGNTPKISPIEPDKLTVNIITLNSIYLILMN